MIEVECLVKADLGHARVIPPRMRTGEHLSSTIRKHAPRQILTVLLEAGELVLRARYRNNRTTQVRILKRILTHNVRVGDDLADVRRALEVQDGRLLLF